MKTVALIDTHHGNGHHLTYMRWFSKSLLEEGHRVLCFYPAPEMVQQWITEKVPQYSDRFHGIYLRNYRRRDLPIFGKLDKENLLLKYLQQPFLVVGRWQYTARAIAETERNLGVKTDLAFFNWVDEYLSFYLSHHWVDRVFKYPWSGLYFRPSEYRFEKLALVPHVAIAQSPYCQGLTLLNEDLIGDIQKNLRQPLWPFPDLTDEAEPEPDVELVQRIRAKAGPRKIVGLLGSLSKRKGILTLLEVARRMQNKDYFFVFTGPLQAHTFHQDYNQVFPREFEYVQKIAADPPENCFFHVGHIVDGPPFNAVVDSCDILFAAYENFPYSSNILTKAAVFHKPVVVSEGYCMAQRVKQYGLGLTVPEGDVEQSMQALTLLSDAGELAQLQLRFDFDGYRRLHSTEQFCKIFRNILTNATSTANETPQKTRIA